MQKWIFLLVSIAISLSFESIANGYRNIDFAAKRFKIEFPTKKDKIVPWLKRVTSADFHKDAFHFVDFLKNHVETYQDEPSKLRDQSSKLHDLANEMSESNQTQLAKMATYLEQAAKKLDMEISADRKIIKRYIEKLDCTAEEIESFENRPDEIWYRYQGRLRDLVKEWNQSIKKIGDVVFLNYGSDVVTSVNFNDGKIKRSRNLLSPSSHQIGLLGTSKFANRSAKSIKFSTSIIDFTPYHFSIPILMESPDFIKWVIGHNNKQRLKIHYRQASYYSRRFDKKGLFPKYNPVDHSIAIDIYREGEGNGKTFSRISFYLGDEEIMGAQWVLMKVLKEAFKKYPRIPSKGRARFREGRPLF